MCLASPGTGAEAKELVSSSRNGIIGNKELKEDLPLVFTELDEVVGLYSQAKLCDDWNRVMGGVLVSLGFLEIAMTAPPECQALDSLSSIITIHMKFNLGQLLQGESTPQDILDFGKCVVKKGDDPLKCHLFAMVGVMCGLFSF